MSGVEEMNNKKFKQSLCLILPIIVLATGFCACNTLPSAKIHQEINTDSKNVSVKTADAIPETSTKAASTPKNLSGTCIEIYKADRKLKLYVEGELFGTFKIALGSSPHGDKTIRGDKKTPAGSYYICTRNDKSRYTLFLGLSYPNMNDAKKGLDTGLITEAAFHAIADAEKTKTMPPWDTPLGGAIGIHGGGNSSDWTLGCIALSDEDIRTLWEKAKLNTPVYIYE